MTVFEETVLPLARAVLPDEKAASRFVAYLQDKWGYLIRQAER